MPNNCLPDGAGRGQIAGFRDLARGGGGSSGTLRLVLLDECRAAVAVAVVTAGGASGAGAGGGSPAGAGAMGASTTTGSPPVEAPAAAAGDGGGSMGHCDAAVSRSAALPTKRLEGSVPDVRCASQT